MENWNSVIDRVMSSLMDLFSGESTGIEGWGGVRIEKKRLDD